MHSLAVTEKRGSFRSWTVLLAIATFSLCLLGTFLVRSGVLTSVHAFAADPTRGVFILIFLGIVVGGSLLLYALRAPVAMSRRRLRLPRRAKRCCSPTTCCWWPPARWCCSARCIRCSPMRWSWARSRSARRTSTLLFMLLMAPLVLLLPFGPLTRWQREQLGSRWRCCCRGPALALGVGIAAFFLARNGRAGDRQLAAGVGAAGRVRASCGRACVPKA